MDWYINVLTNFATFTGRARRKEFWMFTLVNFLVFLVLSIVTALVSTKANSAFVTNVYQLGTLLPSIAVGARRMHDVNRSGWYQLIPIYNLYLLCKEGDPGTNNYGPSPKGDNKPFSSSEAA